MNAEKHAEQIRVADLKAERESNRQRWCDLQPYLGMLEGLAKSAAGLADPRTALPHGASDDVKIACHRLRDAHVNVCAVVAFHFNEMRRLDDELAAHFAPID